MCEQLPDLSLLLYQQEHSLSASAVRRAIGEIDDIEYKVVQTYQDGAALQICVRVEVIYRRSLSLFCLKVQPFLNRKVSVDTPGTIATASASSCDIPVVRSPQHRTQIKCYAAGAFSITLF